MFHFQLTEVTGFCHHTLYFHYLCNYQSFKRGPLPHAQYYATSCGRLAEKAHKKHAFHDQVAHHPVEQAEEQEMVCINEVEMR